ncbi:glutamate-5-semialdehyde dehydrogenase [Acidocella aminolytica 101 = DSM 11237]|jgi:glutamate-5-semialdehyde dehydrogenase|uniref:Gamma-glutamyl phosphate reductase n=2 Tax=Acidocella TaxID=50709 RepID=A0A0D6PHC6_9PROT|nr:glutamate-5-semialdehyde dehydrogenase [Acidocella aminolytica]GAN81082.1 gamma-glutamyl phosphate reductase [Acidocella aminolytica 101 = DSM 11237]GBQ41494.1 gamma-glutamyl phosphate reductase [Acidocella aminolytica 101 = DSM 11237]SHF13056.1 glutamate-5-semialdehyde dehydrogenase [Acidocella aminolytica 101 = DSM 11237]
MHRMNAESNEFSTVMEEMGQKARAAAAALAKLPGSERDAALRETAAALRAAAPAILAANAQDMTNFNGSSAFGDRLLLNEVRLEAMAKGLEDVAGLPDPIARTLAEWTRPNGLRIARVAQPIGVLGMIYESRPNVGADASAIAIKSSNAIILRGGSESFHSAQAIRKALATGLKAAGLPEDTVQVPPSTDRRFVAAMLGAVGQIDLIIPRGGKTLVELVQREARVPVLAHAEGLNHTYIHAAADPDMARKVLANAKMRRTGVCGSTETLLIDAAIAPALLPILVQDLATLGCTFKADERAREICPALPAAEAKDFDTEWLDAVLNIAVVDGPDAALAHVTAHGSEHTEAIITQDEQVAETYLARSRASVTMWNTSTQFCDGGEFGFGAEIGIATGHIHARGPVGPEQLTTFRYVVRGNGQVRP